MMVPTVLIRSAAVALAVALVGTTAAAAPPAPADGDARGQQLLNEAQTLFGRGEFSGALTVLHGASRVAAAEPLLARIALQRGLTHAALGDVKRAEAAFARALRHDPALRLDPERHKPSFVRIFRRQRARLVGTIDVQGDLTVEALRLDGKPVGTLPVRRALLAGAHRLSWRKNARTHQRRITIVAGEVTRLLIPATPAVAPQPPARPSVATPAPEPAPRRLRLWAWVALAGAAASATTAIVLGALATGDRDAACELVDGPCDGDQPLRDPSTLDRYDELKSAMEQKVTGANVAWVIGGVFAASATLLFVLDWRSEEPQGWHVTPSASRDGAGVRALLSF